MQALLLTFVALFIVSNSYAENENWPQWRGPRMDGTSKETNLPTKWSTKENIAWKCPIPGKGHSSPVIWGDRVFLTTCLEGGNRDEAKDRVLICIDRRDGKILWQKVVIKAPLEPIHKLNSFASSTPATDGERVYVTFLDNPKIVVVAFDFEGKEVWRKSPGEFESKHGFCSPPILYKDSIIVNCDQDAFGKKKPAYLISLNRKTGDENWRIDRPNRIRSYCPPLIAEAGGKTQMVLTGCLTVVSYDPDTGKKIWNIDGPTEQFVASMIFHEGLFFLTAGYPTYHVMGIKPDGIGNVTKTHAAWHEERGAGYVPSPVAFEKNVFLVHDDGRASCRDCETGKLKWLERLGKHHSASPIVSEGKLYFPDDDGNTFVLKASSKFELIQKNTIDEEIYASPAVSRGELFLRGSKHLWCIGQSQSR